MTKTIEQFELHYVCTCVSLSIVFQRLLIHPLLCLVHRANRSIHPNIRFHSQSLAPRLLKYPISAICEKHYITKHFCTNIEILKPLHTLQTSANIHQSTPK
jgi:hypothetical protein